MAQGFLNFNVPQSAFNFVGSGPATTNAGSIVSNVAGKIGDTVDGWSNGWNWLGNNGILPTTFMGLQTLTGGLNALTGLQQLQLARDQFDFSKNVANANLNNSVENYYNAIKNANRVGYALQGGYARKAYKADSQEAAATNAADEATKNLTRHV